MQFAQALEETLWKSQINEREINPVLPKPGQRAGGETQAFVGGRGLCCPPRGQGSAAGVAVARPVPGTNPTRWCQQPTHGPGPPGATARGVPAVPGAVPVPSRLCCPTGTGPYWKHPPHNPLRHRESILRGADTSLVPRPSPGSSPSPGARSSPPALRNLQTACLRREDARLSLEHQPVCCFALLLLGMFQNSRHFVRVWRKLINSGENP